MVIPCDPCELCGDDPQYCGCPVHHYPLPEGRAMGKYDDLLHGKPEALPEHHCELCGALDRYCPGHVSDIEILNIRGGLKRMMPVAPRPEASGPYRLALEPTDAARINWGYFVGDPVALWTPDGERMILEKEFAYVDPKTKRWGAPRGAILDGASIPRALWSLVGSPYRGKYRYASIIHDYHCRAQVETWESVHLCFYYACLAGGTGRALAKILYYGVYHFGPKWGYRAPTGYVPVSRGRAPELPMVTVEAIEKFIVETDPTLELLRALDPSELGVTYRNST
jgi:hypothetical protein